MKNKIIYIISILSCILLYIIEQYLGVNYILKSSIKLFLFIGVPLFHIFLIRKTTIKDALNIEKPSLKQFRAGFIMGIGAFGIIIIAYLVLKEYIDLGNIMVELENNVKVTKNTFIFIAIYITFINSLIEEFFFRGFIFMNLYENTNKFIASVFSALLFSLYHMAMFKTWFDPAIMAVALLGLFLTGTIFNWLSIKSKNFINPWIVHLFGDAAIMTIGLKMFGLF